MMPRKQGLYARWPNGRILMCDVWPESCLEDAATVVAAGAAFVSLTLVLNDDERIEWPGDDGRASVRVVGAWEYTKSKRLARTSRARTFAKNRRAS